MSDYSLFQELSGLCPSLLSLVLLALSIDPFSNLDGDSVCAQVVSVDVWLVLVPLQLFYCQFESSSSFLGFLSFLKSVRKNKRKTL